MVPTMIVFGLVLGRWWWAALVAAALLWPAWLVLGGATTAESGLLAPALYGVVNAAVGVAVHQGILAVVRRVRDRGEASHRREVRTAHRDENLKAHARGRPWW